MGKVKAFGGVLISLLVLTGCESDFSVTKVYHGVANPSSLTTGLEVAPAPLPSPSPSATLSCQTVLQQTDKNLRVLFMFDNSTSTKTTDPNHLRVQAMRSFLQTYGSKHNLTYNFSYFAKAAVTIDSMSLSAVPSSPQPFGDSNYLSQAVNLFDHTGASDGTGFKNALILLQNIIANDLTPDSKWDYAIVFMSDGGASDNSTQSDRSKLIQDMQSLVSAKGHELTFSTVYFGPTEDALNKLDKKTIEDTYGIFAPYSELVGNLQTMAAIGKGQFLNTNLMGDGSIVIGDTVSVPGEVCSYK